MTPPPLTIVGSVTSPFVRAVRIACEELDLGYEMELTTFFAKNTQAQEDLVKRVNPLLRIPVLLDGEEVVIDSRIIVSYLIGRYGKGKDFGQDFPLTIAQENRLTTVSGLLDSAVLWFILKATQPNIAMDEGYAARSLDRVHTALGWLEGQSALWEEPFGPVSSLLMCALEWMERRGVVRWSGYPNLVDFHRTFRDRESVEKTHIPDGV